MGSVFSISTLLEYNWKYWLINLSLINTLVVWVTENHLKLIHVNYTNLTFPTKYSLRTYWQENTFLCSIGPGTVLPMIPCASPHWLTSHFQVAFCLCVKTTHNAKPFIWKCVPSTGSFSSRSDSFSYERKVLHENSFWNSNLEMAYYAFYYRPGDWRWGRTQYADVQIHWLVFILTYGEFAS